jgi:hypothetical protein
MKNEIIDWLNGPRDYATGRAIFERHSHKTPLINLFRRKYKPEVLLYNMQKLVSLKYKPEQKSQVVNEVPGGQSFSEKKKVIVQDRVEYDELPVHLQKLYDQNKELYKHMRAYHEKMKQAKTDDERAKLRKFVVEYDDAIAENWKAIDAWDGTATNQEKEEGDTEKDIAAARKWISKNIRYLPLREGLKQQELVFKLQEKVAFMKMQKVKIPKAAIEALEEFGIDI